MNDNYALSALERGYKSLYMDKKVLASLADAKTFNDYFRNFGKLDSSFYRDHQKFASHLPLWEEDSFILQGRDLTIMRYPRYLPPYEHFHNYLELYYTEKKPATQIINQEELSLESGDLLILSPQVRHQFSIMDDEGITFLVGIRTSSFSGTFANILGVDHILSTFFLNALYQTSITPYILFKTQNNYRIKEIIQQMLQENDPDIPLSNQMINLHFEHLCLTLMRFHGDNAFIKYNDDLHESDQLDMICNKILQYIFTNHRTFNLGEAADHFNYSKEHLCRIIKKYTGKTISDICTSVRIQNACHLLINNSTISIEEISDTVGYSDLTIFYKAFKKLNGMTPAEYRKQHFRDAHE